MALMKLAFLCNNMKSTNGVERVLSQRLSLLADSGEYDVYLITSNQYGAPFSFPVSEKVHYVDLATRYIKGCSFHGWFQYLDRFLSKIIYKHVVRRCLFSINPDVITCIDIHLADLTTISELSINATKVVECHCGLSAYYGDIEKYPLDKRSKELKIKEKLVSSVGRFDKVVVMTEAEKEDWGLGNKVVCVPNMLASFSDVDHDNRQTSHRVISVGRYAFQKGYDMLLDAWKIVEGKYPEWSLHIYGSCDGGNGEYDLLNDIIRQSSLQSFVLHPATSDVYSHYIESSFYVMSSRYESFGLTIIEAMACGLPIISFDCKYGPSSIVKNGETGILVPQNNTEKLADAIITMIENEELRDRMGANACLESKKYLPENIMPLWHDFYKSLGIGRSIDA
jgi:glycosyltransferase involved in cell wall biosynthesis